MALPPPLSRACEAMRRTVLAERLRLAHTRWTRLKGLLGTRSLEPGEGLWLKPCNQVHMIGMRYALDAVFLDDQHRVVRTIAGLAPGRISPRVGGASSVLELPAGTLARTGLVEGARVEIDGEAGSASTQPPRVFGALACNVALAVLYVLFAAAHLSVAWRTGRWAITTPIVVQEALLVLFFLTRRRSAATSDRPFDWAVGVAGTILPLLMRPRDEPSPLGWLGGPVQITGVAIAIVGLLCLGRSLGVVAANRGVKTVGAYRVVRHPVYAAYLLSYLGYLTSHPSARNVVIIALTVVLLNARAIAEERFLGRDPAYREYLSRTPWRFVPCVY